MLEPLFTEPVSMQVWDARYRLCETGQVSEPGIEASWERVALALSAVETLHRDDWCKRLKTILSGFRFLPGGRLLAGAGTPWCRTLFNCFVSGRLHDSVGGVFSALSEAMLTM